ncbi:hypothetical protein HMEPL2_18550 [Vreelandella aquamarina]|uniref:Uncharacterized protein n=1 Tax=Vreelandella aquamarina TaxID=77097 RepID=A0A6F8XCP0_9GAMM|nr:hypothetical protein [Halomonas meridiana]BCB71504.1 hypothetical protein HMEPL2_18550 [Halomonas meridiana]
MAKGICANHLENGDVNNVRVDYGNGMIMDIDVDDYIQKEILPDYNQLPDCSAALVKEDESQ